MKPLPRLSTAIAVSLLSIFISAAAQANTGSGPDLKTSVGLQLYSLRAAFATNIPATLDEVKSLGFENVELAGYYGVAPEKFKAMLDERGLKAISGHYPFDRFRTDLDGIIREAKLFGLQYVGCAWVPHNAAFDEKTCRDAIAVFNQAGEKLAANGLTFFSHTHGYEFEPFQDGTLFDLMMRETNPKFVHFQMDVFWIVHAGQDPVKLFAKYGDRWELTHLKDMRDSTPVGFFTGHSDVTNDVIIGQGKIDFVPLLNAAKKAGVKWNFIEDESPQPAEQIPASLRYLATIKWSDLGIFSAHADVGSTAKPGAVEFDVATGEYRVTGGGENMWFTNDAFHFVWEKMSGDFTLAANIQFVGTNGNAHRKACLLVRQSLAAGSAYADVAVHGSGLTALQFRDATDDVTHEVISSDSAPARVRIEKRGDYISLWTESADGELQLACGYQRVPLTDEFYVGLGVCAHDNKASEQAIFSNVQLTPLLPVSAAAKPALECTLETVAVSSGDRTLVYHTRDHIEAPNWSRAGKYFLFNCGGRIYKMATTNGPPELLDTGAAIKCNNDHGISPDGTLLAISDQTIPGGSRVYLVPIEGGAARQITSNAPSYWHGWSPNGRTLAFCGQRANEFDIYTIPVTGGQESRLTTAPGLDDGPDYSPDGKYIYFNSVRSGLMQIWRMKPDGSEQEQVTTDDYNNWFAHPSPDGKWIVFITFPKDVVGHPANQDVTLRAMSLADKKIRVLAKLFGGQGTINVSSWSPDSRNVAYVSYQLVYP